jgi:hypothetical protein
MNYLKRYKNILIILLLTFPAIFSLLLPGLPPTHDGEYHVIRFYEFHKVLSDGTLYPRWAPDLNNGYGIPLFNFVYPLPNYIASILHYFGMNFINAFKINMLLASLIGAVFMYLWARQFFVRIAAIVASVFYTYTPYHFVDIYVRGSVGEVWALGLFPVYLWVFTRAFQLKSMHLSVLSGVVLALLIFSHNILAVMFMAFILSYMVLLVVLSKEEKYIKGCVTSLIFGLTLSTVFWLPALAETNDTVGLQVYDIFANFPELYQLLIPSWGTGFSAGSLTNQMSFQIGIAPLTVMCMTMYTLLRKSKRNEKFIGIFIICWFIVLFFFMLRISSPIWQAIQLMQFFQFPWRLLSLMMVITAFSAGYAVDQMRWRKGGVVLIVLAMGVTFAYARPAYYHQRDDAYYTSRDNFIHGTNSPGNAFNTRWFLSGLAYQKDRISAHQQVSLQNLRIRPTEYAFSYSSNQKELLTINTAYFPGWKAKVQNHELTLGPNTEGKIQVDLPKGNSDVTISFTDTPIRQFSGLISVFSFLVGAGILLKGRVKNLLYDNRH